MKTAFADQMGVDAVGFRKYMDYLSATVTISPLLGLLGTVTGMIGSFSILDSGAGASAITGGVGAVSYTHLDVYKRQMMNNGMKTNVLSLRK